MSTQRHLPMVLQKLIELQQLGLSEPEKKFLTDGLDILSALTESEIAYLRFVKL